MNAELLFHKNRIPALVDGVYLTSEKSMGSNQEETNKAFSEKWKKRIKLQKMRMMLIKHCNTVGICRSMDLIAKIICTSFCLPRKRFSMLVAE